MNIYLRDVRLDDSGLIVKWRNDPSVIKHSIDKSLISEESNRDFFERNILSERYRQYIVYRIDDDYGAISYPIGTVFLKNCDNVSHRCELGSYEDTDVEWSQEAKSVAIVKLLEKAFNEFDMHKVFAYAFADDVKGIQVLKEVGFKKEAVLCSEIIDEDGNYRDIIRYCVFNDWEA